MSELAGRQLHLRLLAEAHYWAGLFDLGLYDGTNTTWQIAYGRASGLIDAVMLGLNLGPDARDTATTELTKAVPIDCTDTIWAQRMLTHLEGLR